MNSRPEHRRHGRALARCAAALLTWLVAAGAWAQGEPAAGLQPYKARYAASYRGIAGGDIENGLRRGAAPGEWVYESRAYPNLLGSIAVSSRARERGVMQVSADGVRPMRFDFDDGTDSANDVRINFDWTAGRARGETKGEPFELELTRGTQDTASVQAAMMIELLAGRSPQGFTIITRGKLRQYRYWSEGRARIATPYGEFDTVVWANQREGSDRLTRVWHAPSLGYLPVQAIQYRKGKAESQLRLVGLER